MSTSNLSPALQILKKHLIAVALLEDKEMTPEKAELGFQQAMEQKENKAMWKGINDALNEIVQKARAHKI